MKRLPLLLCLAVCAASLTHAGAGAAAVAPKVPDLSQSYLFTPAGALAPIRAGVTYQASAFPLALRLTAPDRGWSGTQWKSGRDYFRGGPPPNYGWVHVGKVATPTSVPRGLITIMAAYARTPSVATTVNVLRTRGHGATYTDSIPVTVAGFQGIQFDGQIVGAKNFDHIGHFFIPFSPRSQAAKYYPDEYGVYGDVFRVIVLDVHGKTVVVYIENVALPAEQFPTFLTKANRILDSLRFPT